jgi:hypothetical protein
MTTSAARNADGSEVRVEAVDLALEAVGIEEANREDRSAAARCGHRGS